MCTAGSHFIIEGNCLCGAFQDGEYDEERDFLKRLESIPPTALLKPSKIYKEIEKLEELEDK